MSEKTNKAGDTPTTCDDVIEECQKDLVNGTSSLTQKNLQLETLSMSNELR